MMGADGEVPSADAIAAELQNFLAKQYPSDTDTAPE